MAEDKQRYLSIAIQDHIIFIERVLERNPQVRPISLDLVRRVEEEYAISNAFSLYAAPSGKFAFFNKSIKDELRTDDPLLRRISVQLAGDGYGYLVGGYIESEFFLTPTDRNSVPEEFPFIGIDLGKLSVVRTYARPPESWKKSKKGYQRKKYEEGWVQIKVGINTDLEGNLQTEERVMGKQEKRGIFGKKVVEVPTTTSRLIALPEDREEAIDTVLDDVIRVCQVIEGGINLLYSYARQTFEPIGEVQLAYVYPNNPSQVLFPSKRGGDKMLAKSYSVFNRRGSKIYRHYTDLDEGNIKVKQAREESPSGEGTGTKTVDKPRREPTSGSPPGGMAIESARTPNGGKNEIVTLDDVVGATEAKKELMRVCDYFKNPEEYRRWGISQKAGVLLYGLPGTGKTLLARALAHEADAQFILYKSQDIKTKWAGESQQNLSRLLEDARRYERSVLLFDEFDAIARKRELSDGSSHGTEAELVTILLSFLDGFDKQNNVYLIGTTNRIEIIDNAILQRLYPIEVPLPDLAARSELVRRRIERHATTAQVNPFGEIDYQAIAEASEGLSCRDLVGERQGIFLTLLHKAKELTEQNKGKLYRVSTEDWLDEIKELKQGSQTSSRQIGFHP